MKFNRKESTVGIFVCLLSFLCFSPAKGQALHRPDSSYIRLINGMVTEDQKWRGMIVKHFNHDPDTILSYKESSLCVNRTDSLNYFSLKDIISKIGYPNFDKVGVECSHNFWLLIQHQDSHPQFQDSVLTLMKIEVDKRKAAPDNYAYLVDRVRINTGRLQIYGTQMELDPGKTTYQPKPVEDSENLNARRKSMGLPTMEEYIQLMNERYHGSLKRNK